MLPEDQDYEIVHVRVNEKDLNNLRERGITNPWFIGNHGDVMVRLPTRGIVPVVILIMDPAKGQRITFRDGNPLNMIRANLAIDRRPLTNSAHPFESG